VRRFPGRDELAARDGARAGEIRYVLTAGGIIALHVGTVSAGVSAGHAASVERGRRSAGAPGGAASRVMVGSRSGWPRSPPSHGPSLSHHARATISAGGKRLRPLLVCLAAGPVAESDALVRAAVAVELVHAATLVHDDVLDGASLRRGRPTVVAAGGRLMATATGDLLFSARSPSSPGRGSIEPVRMLSRASGAGRGELMQRADAWDADVSLERYLERCRAEDGASCSAPRASSVR
jgi:hypothetical protein